MPPKRSAAGAGSASAASSAGRTTKPAAGLAQPMLSFQSRKPTGSPRKSAKGKATAPTASILGRTDSATSTTSTVVDKSGDDDEEEIESDEEEEEKVLREKKRQQDVKAASSAGSVASRGKTTADTKVDESAKEHLNVKDKRWNGIYKDAMGQMGGMKPIHAGPDTHNNVHHILRVFDMTSKYGPYIGVSRLQRWERAKKWGLNPPEEIKMILTTVEGENDPAYRENVLHSWLG